jgi:hypothetical protein
MIQRVSESVKAGGRKLAHSLTHLLITLLFCFSASAQLTIGPINFSGPVPTAFNGAGVTNGVCPGPNIASNCAWFCTSARGLGAPRITNLTFSNDLAGAGCVVYACTNWSRITNAGVSGTNQLWLDTTGFASNDVIVLRSDYSDTYQRCLITNTTPGQIMIWPSAGFATTNGPAADWVYKMTPIFTLPGITGQTNYPNYASVTGREGTPLLLDVNYNANGAIRLCVGEYYRRYGQ